MKAISNAGALLAFAALLSACASAPTTLVAAPAAPTGPYYPPSPYDPVSQYGGSLVAFRGEADERISTNYSVKSYKKWSEAGYYGVVTAWNNTGSALCVKLKWNFTPYNGTVWNRPILLPPQAKDYAISYWRTSYEVENSPGYGYDTWSPRASSGTPSHQDCLG